MGPDAVDQLPPVNVQVQIGGGIELGYVALIIFNCPVTPIGDGLEPAIKLDARKAMEVGMNLIHMAKLAEEHAKQNRPVAKTEAERCSTLTPKGQCCLRRAHDGNHAVMQG